MVLNTGPLFNIYIPEFVVFALFRMWHVHISGRAESTNYVCIYCK